MSALRRHLDGCDTLRQICASREQQSAVLGMASHLPSNDGVAIEKHIRYLPCPICHKLMNRVNFANCSGVIVDVCLAHGTWFDRDELRRIVEFIRGGGLEKSRVKEMEDLEASPASRGGGPSPHRTQSDHFWGGHSLRRRFRRGSGRLGPLSEAMMVYSAPH